MTDKETLLAYRLREARETLTDARTLLAGQGSTRTVINRGICRYLNGKGDRFIYCPSSQPVLPSADA